MEWKLTMYPALAIVLGLLLISSVELIIPESQIFTRQSLRDQTKDTSPSMIPLEAQGDSQSMGFNPSFDWALPSFEMLAISLIIALLIYFVARNKFY